MKLPLVNGSVPWKKGRLMFKRVFVESAGNNEFYQSLGKQVITVSEVPSDLEASDLVVLSGGSDINPLLYGEEPHPLTQTKAPVLGHRDRLCVDLYTRATVVGSRVLGICRGHQHIAAMKGIKLIQHLAPAEHGRRKVPFEGKFWASVPKCHHQAVPITKQLRILAHTDRDDGLSFIEAFDCDNGRVLGVQGHPEWCSPEEPFPSWVRRRLFEHLSQE